MIRKERSQFTEYRRIFKEAWGLTSRSFDMWSRAGQEIETVACATSFSPDHIICTLLWIMTILKFNWSIATSN